MPLTLEEFDRVWLREAQRRIAADLVIESNQMMVQLRDELPKGFTPSQLNRYAFRGSRPTLLGLQAVNDSAGILPEVERAILHVKALLIANTQLPEVTAEAIAAALSLTLGRAERVLELVSSLSDFASGGTKTQHGWAKVSLGGPLTLAAYLGFTSLESSLADALDNIMHIAQAPPQARAPLSPQPPVEPGSVFILMSMDSADPFLTDVHNAIKDVCAQFSLQAFRVDDTEPRDQITAQILALLASAELIVADLSGERPNVYYEVGYAHAIGKQPILQRLAGTKLHFDLSVHNVPEYRNITDLKSTLGKRLARILGRQPFHGAPDVD